MSEARVAPHLFVVLGGTGDLMRRKLLPALYHLRQQGLQMAVGVGLGAFVGNWLDHRYGWAPWGLLVGSMLGLAAGMYSLIREALIMNQDPPTKRRD